MATPPENVEIAAPEAEVRQTNVARLAAIAGGAIVLLALVWFFFLRGGEEPAPVEVTAPPVTTPSPTPEVEKRDRKDGPVETFDVFAARDPFQPVGGGGGGGGGAAPATGTDTGTGTGADDDGDVLIDDGGASGGGESIGGHRVRLVDVYPSGNRAQVQVDGTVYTVDEGEQFADNFELVSTSGQCATMLFGDDEFTLCEGEEVLK